MNPYSNAIPIVNRNDGWAPTPRDISTTPGGTMYATTPGGTRILYDRSALLNMRNSPLSKTPTNMPAIPGVTAPIDKTNHKEQPKKSTTKKDDDDLFQMEH